LHRATVAGSGPGTNVVPAFFDLSSSRKLPHGIVFQPLLHSLPLNPPTAQSPVTKPKEELRIPALRLKTPELCYDS